MKKQSLMLLIINLCLPMMYSQAGEFTLFTEGRTVMNAVNVESKLEDVVLETDGFLRRFNPAGVEVKRKVVTGKDFDYLVEKKVFGFSAQLNMVGSLNFERTSSGCQGRETAYLGSVDLTGEPALIEIVKTYTILLCVLRKSSNIVNARALSTIVYKGEKLSFFVEKITLSVIEDQSMAILKAINEEIIYKK